MYFGVVEGFYGPPWDKVDRLSMIDFMGRAGMNIYIYGPKWDPFHRDRWRSPYPQEYLSMFSELVDAARRRSVEPVYAISPGLDIDYSSREDLALLVRKLEALMSHGFESIALFLDDIPPVLRGRGFRSLAEAQARLVNRVYEELTPRVMLFCPTYYWGFPEDYLGELGSLLESRVYIMWTGTAIAPHRLGVADVERFRELAGRPPFIWENYPVNDYFLLRGVKRLHLGPLEGREPGIWSRVAGYAANPAVEAEASKIPLYTIAAARRRLGSYDPRGALGEAVRLLFPEEEWWAVEYLVALNSATPFNPRGDHVPGPGEADRLLEAVGALRRLSNKRLVWEIGPVLDKLEAIARLLRGEKASPSRFVQTAGEYNPPMTPEEEEFFFGKRVSTGHTWGPRG